MRALWGVVFVAGSLLAGGDASAEGERFAARYLDKKFSLWLGGFFPSVDSTIRLDSRFGPGDTIDFEETLGLEDGKSVWFGGVRWRFNRRHQLEGELIQLNRSGLLEFVTEELDIGDYQVQAGARIDSRFDVTIGRLTYGYSVIETDRNSLDLKAGLHLAGFDTLLRLTGNVTQNGMPIGDQGLSFVDEGTDITAPLPHFGVSWAYAISDRFAVRAQGLAFALKIDEWRGSLLDFGLDAQFHPYRRFGIGAGFRYFRATVENDNNDKLFGKFVYEYYGPVVYGLFSF